MSSSSSTSFNCKLAKKKVITNSDNFLLCSHSSVNLHVSLCTKSFSPNYGIKRILFSRSDIKRTSCYGEVLGSHDFLTKVSTLENTVKTQLFIYLGRSPKSNLGVMHFSSALSQTLSPQQESPDRLHSDIQTSVNIQRPGKKAVLCGWDPRGKGASLPGET